MKTNWQTKKLGEVTELLARGLSPRYIDEGGIVVLNQKCIRNHEISFTEARRHDHVNKKHSANKLIQVGDVLVNSTGVGTLGRVAQVRSLETATVADSHITIVRPQKNLFNNLFFGWAMIYVEDLIKELGAGASGQTELARSVLKEMQISYPTSITEQKRIVKKLDDVFEKVTNAKENAEKSLQNSKELFESYLQSVFANPGNDWEEKKLKEIGTTQTGLTPKTAIKKYYGNFVPFVTPADIDIAGDGSIRYDSKGLSEDGLEAGRKIEKNSVLMVCIGATIGKVGFVTQGVSCNQQINTLTPFDGYDAKLFYYILSTKSFFNKVIKSSSQATLPIINKGKWENLSVSFPKSISEQKAIVKKLEALSVETKKLEKIYEQKLADLEELKKSVLSKAFKGEL